METLIRDTFATDSGMLGLWSPSAFTHIHDFDEWEKEFVKDADIERHIISHAFVPIYIHSDGRFVCEVRRVVPGELSLTERESAHLFMASESYLIQSDGELC